MIYLELRDGNLVIPKTEFSSIFRFDWYLSNLIEYDFKMEYGEHKYKLTLWESKNAVLSILDSIRYSRLITYDTDLDYLESLSEKWCLPDWILEAIREKKKEIIEIENPEKKVNIPKKLVNRTFRCVNCGSGYSLLENKPDSCQSHPEKFQWMPGGASYYSCCGKSQEEGQDNPCVVGFHVPCCSDQRYIDSLLED